jgi:shikimate kinase
MEEEQDARDFRKLQEAFDELERMELAARIRKAATVAGITYVAWRLGRLWFGI